MSRPISLALFAHRRSWLRFTPRLQLWLRHLYLRYRQCTIPLGQDMVLCRVLGFFKLYADPRDRSISPHLMMDGYWEPRTTETIIDLMRFDMVAVDVGANLGYFTLLLSALCGPNGRVLAFEPNPETARRLQATLTLCPFGKCVDFHPDVLGATDGEEVNLLMSLDHPGGTHVTSLTPDGTNFIKARTRRLDRVPGALDATLIKIDAEGMEEAIWQGMTAMIAGSRLRYVILEFSPASYRDPAGLLDEAEAAGFAISCIDDLYGVRPISRAEILDGTPLRMLLLQR